MLAVKGKYRVSNLKNSEIEKFCFGLQKQLSTREISINLTKKKKKTLMDFEFVLSSHLLKAILTYS